MSSFLRVGLRYPWLVHKLFHTVADIKHSSRRYGHNRDLFPHGHQIPRPEVRAIVPVVGELATGISCRRWDRDRDRSSSRLNSPDQAYSGSAVSTRWCRPVPIHPIGRKMTARQPAWVLWRNQTVCLNTHLGQLLFSNNRWTGVILFFFERSGGSSTALCSPRTART